MPVLENAKVSLNEVLRVRGQSLHEWELWGLLYQTLKATQDIFLKGEALKDGQPQFLVTPDHLHCLPSGRVVLDPCTVTDIKASACWCQSIKEEQFSAQDAQLEKVYVYMIGQTIQHAAYYEVLDKSQKKLSAVLKTVFRAMCHADVNLRMVIADVLQVCIIHAKKHMNGNDFSTVVMNLQREILGSLPQRKISAQLNDDSLQQKSLDDFKSFKKEDTADFGFHSLPLPCSEKLHPQKDVFLKTQKCTTTFSPKERWKSAYKKVLYHIRNSKETVHQSKEEALESWKSHKAHQSILRVYDELTERRKLLELLRLSINISPGAASAEGVDISPNLLIGIKPKTIAELVLHLQRPKQTAILTTSSTSLPKMDEYDDVFVESGPSSCSSIISDCDAFRKPYYNIEEVALRNFSNKDSESKSLIGPEFIINRLKVHSRIVPFCNDKEFHKTALTVTVVLLTGESLDIECTPSVTGKCLYQLVADYLNLRERYLFGLSYIHKDEHIFLEKKQRLYDLMSSYSPANASSVQMYFRTKFYLDNVHLLRSLHLRHMYYLQLRSDFINGSFYCDSDEVIELSGFALQAEFGNYDFHVLGKEYYLLEHYAPFSCIKMWNRQDLKAKLCDQHAKLYGISKELAETKFTQEMMKLSEYGCHMHKVYQDKRNLASGVWLGIRSKGIDIYEKVSDKRSVCQSYPWQSIKRISFCKKYFCIAPRTESYTGKHVVYRFYTSILYRSQYLFNIAMAHHKFFLKLHTVSKTSEIFIEDLDEEHSYFCDKAGMEKEIGCDLYDTHGKFQLKTKTLRHRSSSQNDLEFLNEPYVPIPITLTKEEDSPKAIPKLVTRSASAPNPVRKRLSARFASTIPKILYGKRTMKFVRLTKDQSHGFGMIVNCGDTCETILRGAFIESILPNSPAHLNGNITPGDQIISVNGTDVQNDHFLTVADLLQSSTKTVDLVIAKTKEISHDAFDIVKIEVSEKPFTKTKGWNVEINANEMPILSEMKNPPKPSPRKKPHDLELSNKCVVPDLTLNHAQNSGHDDAKTKDCRIHNIPDIIASQMKHTNGLTPSKLLHEVGSKLYFSTTKNGTENYLMPGEVFHVVLDKKCGSLGLNIYQGSDSINGEQRHIYIHSVIPNGAADLDGRIKPGDKLLEVNGVLLDNFSYQEVVTKLRESPPVAHLVLEKANLIEIPTDITDTIQYSKNEAIITTNVNTQPSKYSDYIAKDMKRKESSVSVELSLKPSDDFEVDKSYSSLPTLSSGYNSSFCGAKDTDSLTSLQNELGQQLDELSSCRTLLQESIANQEKRPSLSDTTCEFSQRQLPSYRSTPNLVDNLDDDIDGNLNSPLYRNYSTDCLNSTPVLRSRQALLENQSYLCSRGSEELHAVPTVPIRKKKLKKLEDIHNLSNLENTFDVSIRKSMRGLGLGISGGTDAPKRDALSQLIRICKLYPLQPAIECGKLQHGDVILEVNGISMMGLTNMEALEVLRCAPSDVSLKVYRPSKSHIPSFSALKDEAWPFFDSSASSENSSLSQPETNTYNIEPGEFEVTLVKQEGSLGITITRQDCISGVTEEGIFIKDLVREPAISDGRIHPGDKILEVNGTPMSPMSHAEAIEFIRNTPNTVTFKLHRSEPPPTPGYEDAALHKPLRWEAVTYLNICKDNPEKSPLHRRQKLVKNITDKHSSDISTTESNSSNTSSSHEHIIDNVEKVVKNITGKHSSDISTNSSNTSISQDHMIDPLEMVVNLNRHQRPRSLDMLNCSDRKRCSEEDSFHRQASVMCPNNADGEAPTLLKWRGSTLPPSEDDVPPTNGDEVCEEESDEDKPVPFPRTTSRVHEWVHTFDVDLDRGWYGRLGFSLYDPPPPSPGTSRDQLPKAAEVKAVHPNSLAEKDGRIRVGDRLVELKGECLLGKPANEVIDILRKTRGIMKMVFCRLEIRT